MFKLTPDSRPEHGLWSFPRGSLRPAHPARRALRMSRMAGPLPTDRGAVISGLPPAMVLARRLWPRTIVQPPLTEADRASIALQALQNQRRPEQEVKVTFFDRPPEEEPSPWTPQTPDQVAPPADMPAEAP